MSVMRLRRGVVVGAAVLLVVAVAAAFVGRPGPAFEDLAGLRAWAEARGLHCGSDRADGVIDTGRGMTVSTRPLTWLEVGALPSKAAPVTGRWRGIIWVECRRGRHPSQPGCTWGACRCWGALHATGDPELLDRIEREADLPAGGASGR
jgi:hypothetical protein